MSEAADLVTTAMERQRQALELTHRTVTRGTEVQRRVMRSFVDSLDAQRAAMEGTTALFDVALDSSMLVARTTMPTDEAAFARAEARLEEQLSEFDDLREAMWALYARSVEMGVESFDEYAAIYADALDASFESFEDDAGWMRDRMTERTETP